MELLAAVVWVLALGCGDSSGSMSNGGDSNMPPDASGSGGSGGNGGSSSGSGGSATGGAGVPGVAGTAGGESGAGGAAGDASDPVTPVDTSAAANALSEIAEGLPPPTVDCRGSESFQIGCVSASGLYAGVAFDFSCEDDGGLVYVVGSGGGVQCRGEVSGLPLQVNLRLGPVQPRSPGEFAADAATDMTFFSVEHFDREFQTHRNGIYQLEGKYERSLAIVGSAEIDASSSKLRMDGEFAASYMPTGSCAPDSNGLGCDVVRARGTFAGFPIIR